MKKQFALALVFAGLVMNASVRADETVAPAEPVEAAQIEPAQADDTEGAAPKETSFASKAVGYVIAKKDAVVAQAHAHPYIASATAGVTVLAAMVYKCAWFRRLLGMETEEDIQKKYHPKFGL